MSSMPDRSAYPIRRRRLHDREPDHAAAPSAEECIGMVWDLTMNAWGLVDGSETQPRLRKDIFRSGRLNCTERND